MKSAFETWVCLCAASLAVGALAGCSNNAGMPKYRTARPAPLPQMGEPLKDEPVRLEYRVFPWWAVAGTNRGFVLALGTKGPRTAGFRVGPIRTRNVAINDVELRAVRCAWKIVPMGDPRPCFEMRRSDARTLGRPALERALSDLRDQARAAGVRVVGDVRCFAEQPRRGGSRLWCEGMALDVTASGRRTDASKAAEEPETDPDILGDLEPPAVDTRFLLHADASVGMIGDTPIVGASLGFRYRPFEVGFYLLDLQRESLAPMSAGLVGIGFTGLGRLAIGSSRVDFIAGASALAVAVNGSTNPDFDGMYHGFVGIAYQSSWRISGLAQPFIQLRTGIAHGTELAETAAPMIELHLGLTTPERR